MNLQQFIDQYHTTLDEFSRGNPQPIKVMFSHDNDVSLANPFGPAVIGWNKVSEALDYASSRFKDGAVTTPQNIAKYESPQLATILEIETWKAKVNDRENLTSFVLRVTTTFRNEEGTWKIVHRHADSITSFHPDGPLRGTD